MFSRPLIPPVFACIAGILWGSAFTETGPLVFIAFGAFLPLSGFALYKKSTQIFSLALIPAVFAFGAVSISARLSPDHPENHISRFTRDFRSLVVGVVDSDPLVLPGRYRMVLQTKYLGDSSREISGKFRVTVYGEAEPPNCGDTVSVYSKIRQTRNFQNPGGFDYERYMALQGIWVTGYSKPEHVAVLQTHKSIEIIEKFKKFRRCIAELIDTRIEPPAVAAVLAALMLGDKTQITDSEREAFSKAGVSHLLAISGLHVGIIAFICHFGFVRLFSYVPWLLWRGWTRKATAAACVFPVVFYGILTGMSISTQRAVMMVLVFLAALFIDRDSDVSNTLAAAGLAILMIDPAALFSISFQLSFAAVAFIIYGVGRIRQAKKNRRGIQAVFDKLKMIIWVSIFATLGTAPFIMTYFHRISLVGPFVNCMMIPMIGFIVIPLGLLSVFAYPFSGRLSEMLLDASAFILAPAMKLIRSIAKWPFASVETTIPTPMEIVCFYSISCALIYFLGVRVRKVHPASGQPGFKAAVAACVIGLVLLGADISRRIHDYFRNTELSVTILDVGQGSATFLTGPKRTSMLIDGGGFYNNEIFDVGHRIVSPFIRRLKYKSLDTVILSHPDSDHMNGLFYIASHYRVGDFLSVGDPEKYQNYKDLLSIFSEQGVRPAAFDETPRRRRINGVDIAVLHPPKDYLERGTILSRQNDNNNSIVVKIVYGSVSFLFTGDILADAEAELCELYGDRLKSDVLIAPHHGSKTSSTERFLKYVNPKIVVISCGWKNMFHFPHSSVLERYAKYSRDVYRTDINGAIVFQTDGESLSVRPWVEQNSAQSP